MKTTETITTKAALTCAREEECQYLTTDGRAIVCTLAEAESFCDAEGVQLCTAPMPTEEADRMLAHIGGQCFHEKDGEKFTTFEGRPEGYTAPTALEIFQKLTPAQVAYAASTARGEYRGFAALHDLMDANMLLIGDGEFTGTVEDIHRHNATMEEVSALIIAHA